MPASKFIQPNYNTDTGTAYPLNIDSSINVLAQTGVDYAPRAQDTPNMTVIVEAGALLTASGLVSNTLQTSPTIVAPASPNNRIDRIVVNRATGVLSVVTGTAAASPVAPAIPADRLPICQFTLTPTTTSIINAMITDERTFTVGVGGLAFQNANAAAITGGTVAGVAITSSTFNGLTTGNASGNIPISNGTLNVNLNADLLDGQTGAFYQDAGNLNAGTVPLARLDATLSALAGLATGADQLPYSTGTDTFSQTPLTAFARSLLDDATSNTALTTLTATRAEAGAVAVPVLNKLRTVIDVKDFGAVGDGVADDTLKIQAAIDAVGGAGGMVFVPRGVYKTTATLKLDSGVIIQGVGIDSLIKGASVAAPLFQSYGGTASRRYRIVMRDIGIDNSTTVAGGIGIDLRNVTEAKITNVFIQNVDMAVQLYADAGLGCYYNTLTDVSCSSCNTGFWFGQLANENRMISCRTNATTKPAVLSDGSHNHIISPAFEVFGTYGIDISGPAYDTLIISPRLENAPTSGTGIRIVPSAVRTVVISPQYTGLTSGLSDTGSDSVILSGSDGFRFGNGGVLNKYHKKVTASIDFASIPAWATFDSIVSIPGVLATDSVFVTAPPDLEAGVVIVGIPAANAVNVRAANIREVTIDMPLLTFTIDVWGN